MPRNTQANLNQYTDTTSENDNPTLNDYPFNEGDTVLVDWSEGMGAYNEFTGVVEGIHTGAGEPVVSVTDYTTEEFGDTGKTHDVAPEWIMETVDTDDTPDTPDDTDDTIGRDSGVGRFAELTIDPVLIGKGYEITGSTVNGQRINTTVTRIIRNGTEIPDDKNPADMTGDEFRLGDDELHLRTAPEPLNTNNTTGDDATPHTTGNGTEPIDVELYVKYNDTYVDQNGTHRAVITGDTYPVLIERGVKHDVKAELGPDSIKWNHESAFPKWHVRLDDLNEFKRIAENAGTEHDTITVDTTVHPKTGVETTGTRLSTLPTKRDGDARYGSWRVKLTVHNPDAVPVITAFDFDELHHKWKHTALAWEIDGDKLDAVNNALENNGIEFRIGSEVRNNTRLRDGDEWGNDCVPDPTPPPNPSTDNKNTSV